ncbi:Hypothetical predicted protein [Cloeon dipterum]|uniref:RING-type E3 ubiquitin transferase n=2 Tax=Cloeon dipterum TaxID=197152 RepID=A0A8S1D9T3_9INSE|nr:Hypothetical predicted protein [Cloeon dipterum]
MLVKLLDFEGKNKVVALPATSLVKELRKLAIEAFGVKRNAQLQLFSSGKLLEDDKALIFYNITDNYCVNVRTRQDSNAKEEKVKSKPQGRQKDSPKSQFFEVGDSLYYRDPQKGDWREAKLLRISGAQAEADSEEDESNLIFHVLDGETETELELKLENLSPCSYVEFAPEDLEVGMQILAYVCLPKSKQCGWFHTKITKLEPPRRNLKTRVFGSVSAHMEFINLPILYNHRTVNYPKLVKREEWVNAGCELALRTPCKKCFDDPEQRCKSCSCNVCGGKHDEELQLICEECEDIFHTTCASPPVENIESDEEWYCHKCSNVSQKEQEKEKAELQRREEKVKELLQKGKPLESSAATDVISIVPREHFGRIPGVPSGRLWASRRDVSRFGVHLPLNAGICGASKKGVRSVCLTGGAEGDEDHGETVIMSGSGGNPQELKGLNLALAQSCHAELDVKNGAFSRDWQKGLPIRLVRGFQHGNISMFAPISGYRYDGIYKVSAYFKLEIKKRKIWKFILKRDDSEPSPWTSAGLCFMRDMSVGHLEGEPKEGEETRLKKRTLPFEGVPVTKRARVRYRLPPTIVALAKEDTSNKRNWDSLQPALEQGYPDFIRALVETFACCICQETAKDPVTTICGHNVCLSCMKKWLKKSSKASCPCCLASVEGEVDVNQLLDKALKLLLPGYNPVECPEAPSK